MNLLPYVSWRIESHLDVATLEAGIKAQIKPFSWVPDWDYTSHKLSGSISKRGFMVSLLIKFDPQARASEDTNVRNSFQPILFGRFIPNHNGTTICIRMTIHPIIAAFMVFWLSGVGLFIILGILMGLEEKNWTMAIGAVAMFIFGLSMPYIGFWIAANKTKITITEIINDIHQQVENKID